MIERSSDTGHVTYRGETRGEALWNARVTLECRDDDCREHYVVRIDGAWVRAFHNETDARDLANDLRELINR